MMANEFWFSDEQWAVLDPLMPRNRPGAHRVDDRSVISGIVHVLKSGRRWQDCPAEYGPRRRRPTIGSAGGRSRGSGGSCSWPWSRSRRAQFN